MLPAKCELLKCPYCGKEKEVLSLASGNTFRSKYWSDTKVFHPMLPTLYRPYRNALRVVNTILRLMLNPEWVMIIVSIRVN